MYLCGSLFVFKQIIINKYKSKKKVKFYAKIYYKNVLRGADDDAVRVERERSRVITEKRFESYSG
jgi:hypothetical protein